MARVVLWRGSAGRRTSVSAAHQPHAFPLHSTGFEDSRFFPVWAAGPGVPCKAFTAYVSEHCMRRVCLAAMLAVLALAVLAPAGAQTVHWEPGDGAAPDTHHYTICDTIRRVCYDTNLEFLVPVLHDGAAYWVVRADMTILAGFPPDTEYPPGFVAEPWSITGEPLHDMDLLADSLPPGIPSSTFVLLYDGAMRAPFVDESRVLADSLHDTVFGLNRLMDGAGAVRVGETWGDVAVMGVVDGLYIAEYAGEGSASFLVDPAQPMPLAGTYSADRYDPHVRSTMWFYADREHMDTLLERRGDAAVDVSGPDDAMRAGTLAGMSWKSDTYTVRSVTTAPDRAVVRGHAAGAGELDLVMPAFGARYAFWQDGVALEAEYGVAGGVLSARVQHGAGDIAIHAIPDDVCTGDCLGGLVVRAWSGPSVIVYGGGFHGAVRMSLAAGDPGGVAPSLCPPGSIVTVDFDVVESGRPAPVLPHATAYESNLEVSLEREGSSVRASVSGGPGAFTLRMPAMAGVVSYEAGGVPVAPAAESSWHDTVTATIMHAGGAVGYTVRADGPTAWGSGLAIPPPADRTGAIWCGMAEPVNAAVIRDSGVNRQDCGVTKFDGGWNVWC